MHRRLSCLFQLGLLICASFAPIAAAASSNSDRPEVVCTVGMVADIARAVSGLDNRSNTSHPPPTATTTR